MISLASIIVGIPVAFGHSSPTAGFTHWRGVMVSCSVTCVCVACFVASPRRPRMRKLIALALPLLPLFSLLRSGCSTAPRLSAEDRRQDIEWLARWARDQSPLAVLREKHKAMPSSESLKPRYVEFAAQAESNEEFYLVASAFFNVIGAGSCHAYLCGEDFLKWSAVGQGLGIYDWGIPARRLWAASYWARLASGISTRAHPPFRVVVRANHSFTEEEWHHDGITVPRGSEIVKVNGRSCASYLDFLKTQTRLRYDAFPKDWADRYLLIIDEGRDSHGWQVEFLLPDGTRLESFIPKLPGWPSSSTPVPSREAEENCTCVELADTVAYIRIRSMWHGPVSYFFKGYIQKERQRIRGFLARGRGRYKKLIIDIRDNGGGAPEYVYENLVRPFLEAPAIFTQTAEMREEDLQGLRDTALQDLKKQYDLHVTETRRVKPPAGFPAEGWVWFEITRQVRPSERYPFNGSLYVLINGGSGSAADDYADLVRRLRLGTLVGQNTAGGGGAFLAPGVIRLPRSGMIFRVETEILITPEGGVDELFGTAPDLRLPSVGRPASITRGDLLKDEWIQHIITNL